MELDNYLCLVELKWWNEPLGVGEVAQQLGISIETINDDIISDIVHSVRKGVDVALYNWGEIVRLAIRESVPEKDDEM